MKNQNISNDNINKIIENVVKMPFEMYTKRSISIHKLFKKSGYCNYCDFINENNIKNYLFENRKYINDWINYSDDKRVDKGYFIRKIVNNKYEIGLLNIYDKNNKIKIIKEFNLSEEIEACAYFILLELEDFRNKSKK